MRIPRKFFYQEFVCYLKGTKSPLTSCRTYRVLRDWNIHSFQARSYCREKHHYLYHTSSVCPPVRAHIPPCLPLDGFKWYVIFENKKRQILSKCGKNVRHFTKELLIFCCFWWHQFTVKALSSTKISSDLQSALSLSLLPAVCTFLPSSVRTYHRGSH